MMFHKSIYQTYTLSWKDDILLKKVSELAYLSHLIYGFLSPKRLRNAT